MIIVQGMWRVDPAQRDAALAENAEPMRIARGEQGCLEYVVAADPMEPDRIVLSERWERREDLDAHAKAAGRRRKEAAERGDPPGIETSDRVITIFEVSSSQTLG